MGTDIHAGIEYRDNQKWNAYIKPNKYYGSWAGEKPTTADLQLGRNYRLFAILGDVRNGTGFAGVVTGEAVEPMSSDRGVPDDCTDEILNNVLSHEHSATYVTLAEMLAYDWTRTRKLRGVVNASELEEYDRMRAWVKSPPSWCGDVSGSAVERVELEELRRRINELRDNKGFVDKEALKALSSVYATLEWELTYAEGIVEFWEVVLPTMLRLGQLYGIDNVRLVMDFDS